jgi:hypothetical protein
LWLALVLVQLLSVRAPLLPATWSVAGGGLLPWLRSLVLPALALAVGGSAFIARQTRDAMADVDPRLHHRTPCGTVASGDHRPRRPPLEPRTPPSTLGIDRFEHFLQLYDREAPLLCYSATTPFAQMQQCPPADPELEETTFPNERLG